MIQIYGTGDITKRVSLEIEHKKTKGQALILKGWEKRSCKAKGDERGQPIG